MRPSTLGLIALAAAAVTEFLSLATGSAKASAALLAAIVGVGAFLLLLVFAALLKYLKQP